MSKVLCIDYGEKRIGLAVAEKLLGIAHPHLVIPSGENAIDKIAKIISDEGIETVVMGLPRSLNGKEGHQAEAVRHFARLLTEASGIDITFQDERLTSKAAEEILLQMGKSREQRKEIADAHQAAIILQAYLDSIGDE